MGLSEPAGIPGREVSDGLPGVVEAMRYVAQSSCRLRHPPQLREFALGPVAVMPLVTRRNLGTARTVLHAASGESEGRADRGPLMVVAAHFASGASNGGLSFLDRGWPDCRTKGVRRIVAVGLTRPGMGALAFPFPRTRTGRSPAVQAERRIHAGPGGTPDARSSLTASHDDAACRHAGPLADCSRSQRPCRGGSAAATNAQRGPE